MDYSLLRQFADSWGLLFLFILFVGVIIYAFRPGSRDLYRDVAQIPFRHDTIPRETKPADHDHRKKETQS